MPLATRPRRLILILIGAVVTSFPVILWTAPRWIVGSLAEWFPGCLYAVETGAPVVALTIDDGPDSSTTPELLRVLAHNDAEATFFLISGNIPGNDSAVKAMVEAGHEIGNHFTRDQPGIALSPAAFDSALVSAGRTLAAFGPVRWARPGGGRYDQGMVATMRRRGYQCALGSVYPYDAELSSSRFSSAFVLAHARPGAIIVLHDGGGRGRRTISALNRVLPEFARRGLRVVTLSELTATASPPAPRE